MISIWWVPVLLFVGAFIGIALIAIVSASRDSDDGPRWRT